MLFPWVFGAWKPLELAFVLTGCSGLIAACLVHRIQVTTSVTPFFWLQIHVCGKTGKLQCIFLLF